jgi:hypothetical protein
MSAEREVIEHGVEIKHIQADVDSIMEDMEQLKARLDGIEKTLEEIKGGWKVFIAHCHYFFRYCKLDGNSLAR